MEIKELKAKAYDLLATIEQARAMLMEVNQQIAKMQQAKPEPKDDKKEEKPKA